jgi:hypothetical protein
MLRRVVAFFGSFAGLGWTLPDWLTVVGFPLAISAFAVGWQQLREAKRQSVAAAVAAQAAKTAIERTERHLADNHLLILVPELQLLRRDLDDAILGGRQQETIRYLGDWLSVASDVQAILQRRGASAPQQLIDDLQRSAKLTGDAKDNLISREQTPEEATRAVRPLITEICASSMRIIGEMKAFARDLEASSAGSN